MTDPQPPAGDASAGRRLIGATAAMASGTLVSRIFGAVRVILTGLILLPKSRQNDMFAFALLIPTSIYTIVATGLVNAIFVPQIVRAMRHDEDGGEAYVNRIVTAFFLIVLAVTAAATAAAPALTALFTSAQWDDPALAEQYHSMVVLAAFCMPQILLLGAFVLLGQILNARGVFGPMMWAPVANNIVQIVTLGVFCAAWGFGDPATDKNSAAFTGGQIAVLAAGWGLGLVVQFLVLVPFARQVGFRYRPRFDFLHTGLGRTFSLAKWSFAFVGVANVALWAVTPLLMDGTIGGEGAGKGVYDNAYLLFAFPHSLIAVSIATALVPALSALAAQQDMKGFAREVSQGVRLTVAALLPIACLFLVAHRAIPEAYYRGDRGGDLVGWTLLMLAAGLVPYSVQYVLQRAYFSIEDTRSVFYFEAVMAGVWVTLSWLAVRLGHVPANWIAPTIAAALTLSHVVGLAVTLRHMRRRLPRVKTGPLLRHLARTAIAAVPGSLVAGVIIWFQTTRWDAVIPDILGLVAAGLAAVGVYLGMARLMHLTEVTQIADLITQRLRPAPGPDTEEAQMAVVNPPRPDGSLPDPLPPRVPDGSFPIAQATAAPDRLLPPIPAPGELPPPIPAPTGPIIPPHPAAELRADAEQPVLSGFPPLMAGHLLADRYRLEEQIGRERHASRWKATDELLGRPVLIHALEDEDTADSVIQAARQSTAATDARFVRVLDAVADAEGFYIISEWVEGTPLSEVLQAGPLSAVEAAWVAKEIAEPLTTIHPLRLYHRRLDPSRVLVMAGGGIRIAGLVTAAALNPEPGDDAKSREELEHEDVRDLGRILYACLTGAWPGQEAVGLPTAPRGDANYLAPQRIQPSASGALDRLTDQLLSAAPRGGLPPITTAAGALKALSHVLGAADSSADLAHRLVLAANSPAVTPAWVAPAEPVPPAEPVEAPAAPVAPSRPSRRPWSLGLLALGVLVVLGLLTALIVGLFNRSQGDETPSGSESSGTTSATPAAGTPTVIPIREAWAFDPFGSGTENDEEVPLGFDGSEATAWYTEAYPTGRFTDANQDPKPGVGYVIDLGETTVVRKVWLTLVNCPTPLTVYAADAGLTSPNLSGFDGWTEVGQSTQVGPASDPPQPSKLAVDVTATSRFIMVFFDQDLPSNGAGEFQTGIAEIQVTR